MASAGFFILKSSQSKAFDEIVPLNVFHEKANASSVTRFGKISPLWRKILFGLIKYLAKIVIDCGRFCIQMAIFHGCKWANNENYKSLLFT